VIGARDAHGILGRDVRSAANEDMGRIVDVIVDREGTVRAASSISAAFSALVAGKSWSTGTELRFAGVASKSDSITLELTKEQVTAAPEYKEDAPRHCARRGGRLQPWDLEH